jgi:Macrophage migration inhibitory factor (MIF)
MIFHTRLSRDNQDASGTPDESCRGIYWFQIGYFKQGPMVPNTRCVTGEKVPGFFRVAFVLMSGQPGHAAFADLRSIGGLSGDTNRKLTERICDVLEELLAIPPDRVYASFTMFKPATGAGMARPLADAVRSVCAQDCSLAQDADRWLGSPSSTCSIRLNSVTVGLVRGRRSLLFQSVLRSWNGEKPLTLLPATSAWVGRAATAQLLVPECQPKRLAHGSW